MFYMIWRNGPFKKSVLKKSEIFFLRIEFAKNRPLKSFFGTAIQFEQFEFFGRISSGFLNVNAYFWTFAHINCVQM